MIVGAVLAVLFLGLLFAAPRFLPRGIEAANRTETAQIPPGFTGMRLIGSWNLACAPVRTAAGAKQPDPEMAAGRCRMARGYRAQNGQLVLAVAFRYAGPRKALTMIVRFPPVGRQGQYLLVKLGRQGGLRLPVFGCANGSCVAVGALIPAAQSLLLSAPAAQVVLPPRADGKQYSIGIRLDGLAPALAGMRRAGP
jgi:invasion protein IalB